MTEHFVLPDVRAFLEAMEKQPRPVFNDEFMKVIRQMPSDLMAAMDEPVGELGEIRDVVMPGPAGDIAMRLFDPRKVRGPSPVVVFYHGGGFVVGSIGTHAGLAAAIARGLDLPVISVEYRLAPEDKWPAAPDDAEAATRWIAENGAAFGREFTHLIPCGDSAGGNLALVTTIALRDAPAALPVAFQFVIYPRADATCVRPSFEIFADGFGMQSANMTYYGEAYGADPDHWRHSPIVADLSGLPPMLMVTAGLDPLRDDGRAYAAAAIDAGGQVTYREVAGTIHGFMSYRRMIPSAKAETDRIIALAKTLIAEAMTA